MPREVLGIDRWRFAADPPAGPVLAHGALTRAGRHIDLFRYGLPSDTHLALSARSGGGVHGWFELTAATRILRPTRGQRRIVPALAHQAALPWRPHRSRTAADPPTAEGRQATAGSGAISTA